MTYRRSLWSGTKSKAVHYNKHGGGAEQFS